MDHDIVELVEGQLKLPPGALQVAWYVFVP